MFKSITVKEIVYSQWFQELARDDVVLHSMSDIHIHNEHCETFCDDPMDWIKLLITSYSASNKRLQQDLLKMIQTDTRPWLIPEKAFPIHCKTCPNHKPWYKFW